MQFKSILSIGYGRLHLVQSAEWLSKAGMGVSLLCGWVPKKTNSIIVWLCSKIVGRNIAPGLKKRIVMLDPNLNVRVRSCAWVEFVSNALLLVDRKIFRKKMHSAVESFVWSMFGWQTRRIIKREIIHNGAKVFHVRSGAGQGGAIQVAKKYGAKILVDHSALHPEQSEINLKEDCIRWGVPVPIAPHSGVWKNVLKDCAEADILMVNANHIRDSFVSRGFDPKKIRVVYLGVRDDFRNVTLNRLEAGIVNEVPRILFTGAFYLLKGAEYLLESLRILKERGVVVRCDIVGSVNSPIALLEKYNDLPITFHGPVGQDDIKNFLANSDIYLFPSLADGCAQSGMEALTAGLPVVATYQSGLPITDGETGCVVPMKDASAIADKIEWLIAHPEERKRLGVNAAKMMREQYTWEKYAENVKKIYEEMIENE